MATKSISISGLNISFGFSTAHSLSKYSIVKIYRTVLSKISNMVENLLYIAGSVEIIKDSKLRKIKLNINFSKYWLFNKVLILLLKFNILITSYLRLKIKLMHFFFFVHVVKEIYNLTLGIILPKT